jgi:hypothetical protein
LRCAPQAEKAEPDASHLRVFAFPFCLSPFLKKKTDCAHKAKRKMPKEGKCAIAVVVAVVVVAAILYLVFVQPIISADTRILLIASDVLDQAGGRAKFESYLSSGNVALVMYNYDRVATYAEFGDLVKAHVESTGAARVRSVGIMYHTPNRYNLKCFASDPEKSTVSGSLESFESFRRFVVELRGAYGVEDVDLISCDVVSAETGVISALDFNGARVNASTNTTGQVQQGPVGDWVLEAGNVNLIGRYFNATITRADLALQVRHRTFWNRKAAKCNAAGSCCADCASAVAGVNYGTEAECKPGTYVTYVNPRSDMGPFVLQNHLIRGSTVRTGSCAEWNTPIQTRPPARPISQATPTAPRSHGNFPPGANGAGHIQK